MRIPRFYITAFITIVLIVVLGTRILLPAPLAALLSPQQGIWQNAEPSAINYSEDMNFPELEGKATVCFDDRLVPHIFAENDNDAYFIQGYLHAKFRLWQMEFETHAAAGRLCEIMGEKTGDVNLLNKVDRYFRRLGLPYAAEKSLVFIESDANAKAMCNAYTAGVNAYIASLKKGQLPLEYKLMGYKPELWTNYKTALFIKYMAFDLAGGENDFEFTAAKNVMGSIDFETINPLRPDSLDPIIPGDAWIEKPGVNVEMPQNVNSIYFNYQNNAQALPEEPIKPNQENGSNNWAVNGKKTRSGYPILCNDPHLGLNLPSLWYEMQMHTPNFNAYGVSFPAAPGVIIGFNDSCAFGVTNAGRDVRDYYEITFKDASRTSYLYNGKWVETAFRYERIKIKGAADVIDTVAYTVFGPVIFDNSYANRTNDGKSYAVRWKAHDPSNELKMFQQLDKAKNYSDYLKAIKNLETPGQNCVFAAKTGDIAIWCQGSFPAKWRRQGDFVMPGTDSTYNWQGIIPQIENPHMVNPERGFVSSANQLPVDTSYPYYIGGNFPNYRGWIINKKLSQMEDITPQDMMELQTDNYNVFAEMARPLLIKNMNTNLLDIDAKKYWDILVEWDLRNDTDEQGPAIFTSLWNSLEKEIWSDEMEVTNSNYFPYQSTLLEGLLKNVEYKYVDNITTPQKETLADNIRTAMEKITPALKKADAEGKFGWAAFKDTRVNHLTRLPALSRLHLPIGGGTHIINATKADHGPSWRMIVSLTPETEAYGVYPGGQNGNPGSKYYDSFIDSWASGKYYPLWVMKELEIKDKRVKYAITFNQ